MNHAGFRLEVHMTACWRTQRGRRWPWPLLGLLLVVLMLGHDALMAVEAMAGPHGAGATVHHGGSGSAQDDALSSHRDPAPLPAHPEQCSVSMEAVVRSPDASRMAQLPLPATQVMPVIITLERAPGWDRAATWQEPHWPPGRLRAVTQVYRI